MEPARTIVSRLGGPNAVAAIVGVHRTRVSNWMRPREKGGTGGIIPHWHVAELLSYARANGKELSEGDFAPRLSVGLDRAVQRAVETGKRPSPPAPSDLAGAA